MVRKIVCAVAVAGVANLSMQGVAWADQSVAPNPDRSTLVAPDKGLDSDPHLPLPQWAAAAEAAKFAAAEARVHGTGRGMTPTVVDPGSPPPTAHAMTGRQQDQATSYYCGPAAVSEALAHLGISASQSTVAAQLRTTTAGTAWSGVNANVSTAKTGYPVPDVLNYHLRNRSLRYYPVGHGTATSTVIANFKTRVVADIAANDPVFGDAYETGSSAYHLKGHPTDRPIYHWYTMYGYSSSGASISYEDSAHSSHVSWGSGVPEYSTYPATWLATINAGRGYVW